MSFLQLNVYYHVGDERIQNMFTCKCETQQCYSVILILFNEFELVQLIRFWVCEFGARSF